MIYLYWWSIWRCWIWFFCCSMAFQSVNSILFILTQVYFIHQVCLILTYIWFVLRSFWDWLPIDLLFLFVIKCINLRRLLYGRLIYFKTIFMWIWNGYCRFFLWLILQVLFIFSILLVCTIIHIHIVRYPLMTIRTLHFYQHNTLSIDPLMLIPHLLLIVDFGRIKL